MVFPWIWFGLIIALFLEDFLKGSQTHTGLTDLLVWYSHSCIRARRAVQYTAL